MSNSERLSVISKIGIGIFGATAVVACVDKFVDPLDRWGPVSADASTQSEVAVVSLRSDMEEEAPAEYIGDGVYIAAIFGSAALTLAGAAIPRRNR